MSNSHHPRNARYAQHPAYPAYPEYAEYAESDAYDAYDPYGHPGPAPAPPPPPVDFHSAETLAYGVYVAPGQQGTPGLYGMTGAYDDTYRPAYETPAYEAMPYGVPANAAHAYEAAAGDAVAGEAPTLVDWSPVPVDSAAPTVPALSLPLPVPLSVPVGVGRRAGRRRRARDAERPERSESAVRRLLPQALVVAFLAGGTAAFVAEDKAVALTVDGEQRTLHTFADDVTELLAEEGVAVGPHDAVAPARGTPLTSGDEIAVRYGRPVRLTLDGQRREVWTTAHTVDEALRQFGVRAEGAYLSVSRSQRIGRGGLALDVRTERAVTILADGRARTVRTNAATVGEAVEQAGITLRGEDAISVHSGSFPRDGQTVTVLRITGAQEVREEAIPFAVRRAEDPSLFRGTEVVEQAGQPGLRRITYSLRTVNGVREKPRRLRSEIVREPRARLVKVGTRPLPASVRGADDLNWRELAVCESGGRPDAVDPSGTYGGLYQFDTRTWQSLGGTGRPQDAPPTEQTFRAKKLYVKRGSAPWPHCGAQLKS
ncbi:ubiquitin-like domain-containing protein [Streptomyces sp. NPDC002328]|uniref:ubiquitin-like domain-containing protein n=1 Tax=Streptomyces sp. NPDC002328 TaxID=3364642 RepID=UPI0036CC5629